MSSDLPIDLAALAAHLREKGYTIDYPLVVAKLEPGFVVHSRTRRIWVLRIDEVWNLRIWNRLARDGRGPIYSVDPAIPDAIERVEAIVAGNAV